MRLRTRIMLLTILTALVGLYDPAWLLIALPFAIGGTFFNDLKNNLKDDAAGNSIRPQTATSTVTGQAVDLVDTDGPCFAAIQVGTVSGTSPTLDVKVQESDTSGGTYADIAGATFTQVTASNKSQVINFKRSKRFCKLIGTIAGTTPSFALAGQLYGMKKSV